MTTFLRIGVFLVLFAAWFGPAAPQSRAGQALNPFLGNFTDAKLFEQVCDCMNINTGKLVSVLLVGTRTCCKSCSIDRPRWSSLCRARKHSWRCPI